MWCLISQTDSKVLYIITQDRDVTVGRILDPQNSNFVAIEDASISRKHATLSISQNNLFLQDLGSRYGTFVNQSDEKIGNTKVQLKHEDIVKFGKLNSVWTVSEIRLVSCASTLKGENLQNLRIVLGKLGGILKNEWDDTCTYLTMPAITLTIKVVLALTQGSHIVTTQYWNECLNAVNNSLAIPDPNNFTPQVIESTINKDDVSFLPDKRRSKLFTGKKIIFFSRRQLELYKMILSNSSATAQLLSESKMTKSMLCSPDVVVIQYNIGTTSQESQAQRNQINDIVNYLNSKGKRAVADAEIGLAILYCSTIKYCNPDFSFTSEVFKPPPTPSTANVNVLAEDTQEESLQKVHFKKENIVINESLTDTIMLTSAQNTSFNTTGISGEVLTGCKRKLNEDISEGITNKIKKIAPEIPTQQKLSDVDSAKRKLNDEDAQATPSKKIALNRSGNNDNDDFFNFIDSATEIVKPSKTTEKKINFFKPTKRNVDTVTNNDDLFNFVQDTDKLCTKQTTIKKMFDTSKTGRGTHNNTEGSLVSQGDQSSSSRALKEESQDEDLYSIMRNLDLGSTIVKVRRDLIVKKELLKIEEQSEAKNFKNFKKVWPVNMQVTIIPKSSMSVVKAEGFSAAEIGSLILSDD